MTGGRAGAMARLGLVCGVVVGVVVGALAASGCAPGDGDRAEVETRPGVATVHDFRATMAFQQVWIDDVAQIGRRIVVLAIRAEVIGLDPLGAEIIGSTPYYLVSDDEGASWTEHDVDFATSMDTYPQYGRPDGGLFVHDGTLYELVPDIVERGLGDFLVMRIYRVDLDANLRRWIGTIEAEHYYLDGVGISGTFGDQWISWDPATAAEIERRPILDPPPPGRVGCSGRWYDQGAGFPPPSRVLRQTCAREMSPVDPMARWCTTTASPPADFHGTQRCIDESEWPIRAADVQLVLNAPPGMLVLTGSSSATRRTSLAVIDAAGASLEPIGAGDPQDRYDADTRALGLERDRYAGMVPLVEPLADGRTSTTLYVRRGDGSFAASPIPTRPCADGAPCGFLPRTPTGGSIDSVLQWVEPVGRDAALVFYVVDTNLRSSLSSRNVIYVERVAIETPDPFPPVRAPILDACARATSCFDETVLGVHDCLEDMRNAPVERFDALLAAEDCAAVRAALPSFGASACTTVTTSCEGTVLVTTCDGARLSDYDCAERGGTCELIEGFANCVGETFCAPDMTACLPDGRLDACGTIVDCTAEGLGCAVDATGQARCMPAEPMCLAAGPICLDDHTVGQCLAEGHGVVGQDCSRVPRLACQGGGCVTAEPSDCAPDRCEGTRMIVCHYSVALEADCADLGLGCVIDARESARCR